MRMTPADYDARRRRYLGDGVYVNVDGEAIVLTTDNGIETTNTIVLEPDVWDALCTWVVETGRLHGDEASS